MLALLLSFVPCLHAQTQGCSVSGSDVSGSTQSYAYCEPGIINGRNKGGWIALRRLGDQGNTEAQCYDPGQVLIQDGNLTEVLKQGSLTCHYWPAQFGSSSQTQSFISAFVQWNTFSFTYGDIIIRMKGPSGIANGAWPALWLLGANCEATSKVTADNGTFAGQTCNWPSSGSEEIDIFEQNATITNTKSTCNLYAGTTTQNTYTVTDPSLAFHLYEARWTVGSLQFYYDGVHQTGCDVTATVPTTPMFLQMNIATQSNVTNAATPASMEVDWVKVCQPSPCSGNGGNIIFFDDFVTPIAASLLRPMARVARFAGANLPSNIAPTVSPRGIFAHLETPRKEDADESIY